MKGQLQLELGQATTEKIPEFHCWSRLSPARPTVVYESYWQFAKERQDIFFRRLHGAPPPWSRDPIMMTYKFTNAYRASDRVSQYLIGDVIYGKGRSMDADEVFFRVILFKTFNRIETWEAIQSNLGEVSVREFSVERYAQILSKIRREGGRIYSAAYIMPSGKFLFGPGEKHISHLRLLEMMIQDKLWLKLSDCRKMQQAFELLKAYPMIGDFLAYQYVVDLNYSEITNFSESEFVMPGPGARDGLRKCFSDPGALSDPELIRLVCDRQEEEFERMGGGFQNLWGRRLQLIDCQNIFCEIGKYARAAHPEVAGPSGRTRIKQKFRPSATRVVAWYPPKWGLNTLIEESAYELK
jgi:hypothetical protein